MNKSTESISRAGLLALALSAPGMLAQPSAVRAEAGTHAMHALAANQPHAGHEHHAERAQQAPTGGGRADTVVVRLADVALIDQFNHERRLESDVIGDRVAVIAFVYTSCTTVCPVVSAIMSQVRDRLGARVGKDVALVSITVDPVRDTPERLLAVASAYGIAEGWSWLTGTTTAVNDTLKGLGIWTPDFEDHPVVTMVGDGRTGQWKRLYGFADPGALIAQVNKFSAARVAAAKE